MLERWIIIISGAAFSPFLYILFVVIIYNITIQLRINNIYKNNYASAIRHNIKNYYVVANGRSIIIWLFFSYAIPKC